MSEFSDCPVCNQTFPIHRLPSHVENCLESGASPPNTHNTVAARNSTKRPFHSNFLNFFFFFFFFFSFFEALSPRFEELQKQRAHCPLCRQDVPALGLGLYTPKKKKQNINTNSHNFPIFLFCDFRFSQQSCSVLSRHHATNWFVFFFFFFFSLFTLSSFSFFFFFFFKKNSSP
jgi:hypothetical protein